MTTINPEPADTSKVEPKTKLGVLGFYLSAVVLLAITDASTADNNALLLEAVPDALEWFILPLVPALVGFAASYAAKHQWRVKPGEKGGASSTAVG